eukprot:Gb_06476 [translate_table: standard]
MIRHSIAAICCLLFNFIESHSKRIVFLQNWSISDNLLLAIAPQQLIIYSDGFKSNSIYTSSIVIFLCKSKLPKTEHGKAVKLLQRRVKLKNQGNVEMPKLKALCLNGK